MGPLSGVIGSPSIAETFPPLSEVTSCAGLDRQHYGDSLCKQKWA